MTTSTAARQQRVTIILAVAVIAGGLLYGLGRSPAGATGTPLQAVAVSAGGNETCAVMSDATARCWGSNAGGELGDGTKVDSSLPVTVLNSAGTAPLGGITQIAAGNTSCALLADSTVDCWGSNANGALGIGTTTGPEDCGGTPCSTLPVPVDDTPGTGTLTGVSRISVGGNRACAVLATGTASCWGANLGAATRPKPLTDTSQTTPLTGITRVAIAPGHLCALLADTTARCWGSNLFGQLGNGGATGPQPYIPNTAGPALTGILDIEAGANNTCALMTGGFAECWGYGGYGENANGGNGPQSRPNEVQKVGGTGTLTGVAGIAVGGTTVCARMTDGTANCWGDNGAYQLGVGGVVADAPSWCDAACSTYPIAVENHAGTGLLTGVTSITGNDTTHMCALLADGTVQCWGRNGSSELGDGTAQDRCVPITVGVVSPPDVVPAAPTNVTAVNGDRQATVYWTPPPLVPDDCRQPFDFVVTATPGNVVTHPDTKYLLSASGGRKGLVFDGLKPGVAYQFSVAATNATGTGPASSLSNAVTPTGHTPIAPDAPIGVKANPGDGQVTVSWTAGANNGRPILAYLVSSTDLAVNGFPVDAPATHFTFSGLTNGKTYAFTVSALNQMGTGPASAVSNTVIVGTPAAPLAPAARVGNARATVSWQAPAANVSPISAYVVTPYIGAAAQPAQTFAPGSTTQVITGLQNAKSYRFVITAENSLGAGPGAATPALVIGAPNAPAKPTATAAKKSVVVRWAASPNNGAVIAHYVLVVHKGTATVRTITLGKVTKTIVTGLTTGTAYTFTVAAKNSRGTGAPSAASKPVKAK